MLLDMISIEQIKNEGFRWKQQAPSEDEELMRILSLR